MTMEHLTLKEKCKQSVKDALLTDSTGTISLSLWEEHFGCLVIDHFYELSNLKFRYFNGKTWTFLPLTDMQEIDAFETQAVVVENYENKTACCPAILNIVVNIYPTCNNKQCKIKLSVPPGAVVVTCATCKWKLLLKLWLKSMFLCSWKMLKITNKQ